MMPITVTIGKDVLYTELLDWLKNINPGEYVYIWPSHEVTFFYDEDAIAFMFKFNGQRKYTKVELLIKDAE